MRYNSSIWSIRKKYTMGKFRLIGAIIQSHFFSRRKFRERSMNINFFFVVRKWIELIECNRLHFRDLLVLDPHPCISLAGCSAPAARLTSRRWRPHCQRHCQRQRRCQRHYGAASRPQSARVIASIKCQGEPSVLFPRHLLDLPHRDAEVKAQKFDFVI